MSLSFKKAITVLICAVLCALLCITSAFALKANSAEMPLSVECPDGSINVALPSGFFEDNLTLSALDSGIVLSPDNGFMITKATLTAFLDDEQTASADILTFCTVSVSGENTNVTTGNPAASTAEDEEASDSVDGSVLSLLPPELFLKADRFVLSVQAEKIASDHIPAITYDSNLWFTREEEPETVPLEDPIEIDNNYEEVESADTGVVIPDETVLSEPAPTYIEREDFYSETVESLTDIDFDDIAKHYGKVFNGWTLSYSNGLRAAVKPGDTVWFYDDCTLSAEWIDCIAISVTPIEYTKVYDGTNTVNLSLSESLIITGSNGVIECNPQGLTPVCSTADVTDSGRVTIDAEDSPVLFDEDGEPLYFGSSVYFIYGSSKLTIDKRPLSVETSDASAVYTGKPLTNETGYTADGLADGDYIREIDFSGAQTVPGSSDNTVSNIIICNAAGRDVSSDYEISVKTGTLSVSKAPLTIKATDASFEYDGTSHSAAFEAVGLCAPDKIIISSKQSATFVSESGTVCTPEIVSLTDDYGNDASGCYDISYENAKVNISKRNITLESASASKYYDGNSLSANSYKISVGSLAVGDKFDTVKITGVQIYTGTGKNTFDSKSTIIKNSDGKAVTDNYNITYVAGTLEVKEDLSRKTLTITVRSGVTTDKIYDSKTLKVDADDFTITGLPDGYRWLINLDPTTTSITDVGSKTVKINSYVIYDSNGEIVDSSTDSKFNISINKITLTVEPRPITLTAASASKTYDGKPLECHKIASTSGTLASDNHSLSISDVTFSGSRTEVGTSANRITSAIIRDGNGKDVTSNYSITFVDGSLKVNAASGATGSSTATPSTGDNGLTLFYCILLFSSTCALSVLLIKRLKEDN